MKNLIEFTAQLNEKMKEKALKQLAELEEIKERYDGNETDEELIELAKTDEDAAEVLMLRYMRGYEFAKAAPYIKQTLSNNSVTAANFVEGLTEYKTYQFDRSVILYGLVVSEQYYDDRSGKKLLKLYAKNQNGENKYIDEADEKVLETALVKSLFTAKCGGEYEKMEFVISRAPKKSAVRDYKNSFVFSLLLYNGGDSAAYEDVSVYVFNPRHKKQNETDATLIILEKLKALGENAARIVNANECEIILLGKSFTFKFNSAKLDNSLHKASFNAVKGKLKDEELNLKVNITEQNALNPYACTTCGKPITADNICPYCGNKHEPKMPHGGQATLDKNGNILLEVNEVQKENALNVLSCSQCGSPISVNGNDGEHALCKSCGSSFLINKKALGIISEGINRQKMEQEKPKGEQIPELNFIVKSLYDGKLGVIMPTEFELMDTKMKALKYCRTATPPEFVFTNPSGATNFTFTVLYGQLPDESKLNEFHIATLKSLKAMIPSASWGSEGKFSSLEHDIFFFDFITPAADTEIYNIMIHFFLSGQLVRGAFNCLAKDRWFWGQIFKLSAQSLRFAD